MALQICPNCQIQSFSWTYNEEDTPTTSWGCNNCGYFACEDESFARKCSSCERKTEYHLADDTEIYWWCPICNKKTLILE